MIEVWEATYALGYLKYPISQIIEFEKDDDYGITGDGKKILLSKGIKLIFLTKLNKRFCIYFDGNRRQENCIVINDNKYTYFEMKPDVSKFRLFLERELIRDAIEALP